MHTYRVKNGERVPTSPAVGGLCRHLGGNATIEECGSCTERAQRRTALKVYPCAVHGRCTLQTRMEGVAGCCGDDCPDYAAVPKLPTAEGYAVATTVRNLIYHVYPRTSNGIWQRNVALLLRRIRLFNGRRVVAIATDGSTDPPGHVKDAFAGHVHEFIETQNDPALREVATFLPLMERVETTTPGHVTFWAHAKGVTRPVNAGVTVHPWTDALYDTCLDYWPLVESLLRRYPVVGSMKKVGQGFQGSASAWHYSGAYLWFRCRDVFSRDWRRIDKQWWGTEAWPGLLFRPEEAGVTFHEGHVPTLDLYRMDYLKGTVEPELERWRAAHAAERKEWGPC